MRVINVSLSELETKVLMIGFEGENEITQVRIDAAEILTDYPNATPTLIAKPLFGFAYPVIVAQDGTDVVWEIDNSVLSFHGDGEIQLTFTAGSVIAKSYVGRIRIKRSLAVNGEAPDPIETWEQAATAKLAEVDAQIDELEDMVEAAEAAKDQAQDIVDDAAADIQAAGAAQVQVVQAKGTEVINSIPSDYTELSDDVTSLKSAIVDIEEEIENLSTVPTNVRESILTLFKNAVYKDTGLTDEINIVKSWAETATAITLNHTTISISGTGTSQLVAITTPPGGTITWSSSDTSIATVNSSGLVTGCNNGTATITATCGDISAKCTATVTGLATLESIEATYTQSGTVYENETLSNLVPYLVVVANYSDSTTATLSSDQYILSGTLTAGTSTITVSYAGKTDTFNVTVTAVPTVSSISAVYTPSGTLYDWDSPTLNSLKSDLVVTATWSDTTQTTVSSNDYTLSGTLETGSNTVTVSYSGKTTTFICLVCGFTFTKGYLNGKITDNLIRVKSNTARVIADSPVGVTPFKYEDGTASIFYGVPMGGYGKVIFDSSMIGYRKGMTICEWDAESNEFVEVSNTGWSVIDQASVTSGFTINADYRNKGYYIGVHISGSTGSEDMSQVDTSDWAIRLDYYS